MLGTMLRHTTTTKATNSAEHPLLRAGSVDATPKLWNRLLCGLRQMDNDYEQFNSLSG